MGIRITNGGPTGLPQLRREEGSNTGGTETLLRREQGIGVPGRVVFVYEKADEGNIADRRAGGGLCRL